MSRIFDFSGLTVGWVENDTLYDCQGHPVAFIHQGSVFAARCGQYLGRFDDGAFRDSLGCITGRTSAATHSAAFPLPKEKSSPPPVMLRSVRGALPPPATVPETAPPLLNRSALSWAQFLEGFQAKWPWEIS